MVSYIERLCCKDTIGTGPRSVRGLPGLGMKEFYHPGLIPSPPAVIPSRKLIPTLRVAGALTPQRTLTLSAAKMPPRERKPL